MLLFFYARVASNKTLAIANFIISHNIDVCVVTETWLPNHISPALLNELIPDGFKFIHEPCSARRGGGLAVIYKKNTAVKKKTLEESKFVNFECQNCTITLNDKSVFLGIVYRPPPSKANGFPKSSFFKEWEEYLNNLVLLKHEILLTGDINFHLECTSSSDNKQFFSLLDFFNYTLHIDDAIHICGHTLDFVASLDNSLVLCEKPLVIDTLITDSFSGKTLDHSALVCKLTPSLLSPKSHKISFRNLKNIDLESLSNTLSQKLLSFPSYQDTNAILQ